MILMAKLDRSDPSFYLTMGPLFGSRQVAKEVGINMYDDENKQWFAALSDKNIGEVIGIASIRGRLISDCYVLPSNRKCGVFTAVLAYVLSNTSGPLRANCTGMSFGPFQKAGFVVKSKSKNFTMMELPRA